ncbi:MAG: nucleotide exchange factor GrpE [Rhodospirillales bacterium]|nr:nucleotide exchange factor GrpE [Rhodospirillales bacterium]
MTTQNEPEPQDAPETASPESTLPADAATPDRAAALEAELAATKDKWLRAMAEAENIRKRAERDRDDARRYAVGNFASDMLTVADNLRRAVAAVAPAARAADPALETLVTGVEMTEKAMVTGLERVGIRAIDAIGQKYDANRHEALYEVEDATKPSGTVVQEVEKGYMIHDRLLRPSRVGISKGGAAASAVPTPGAPTEPVKEAKAYEKPTDASGTKFDEKL